MFHANMLCLLTCVLFALNHCLRCFYTVGWAAVRYINLTHVGFRAHVKITSHIVLYHLFPHLNPDWFYRSGTGLSRLSWTKSR